MSNKIIKQTEEYMKPESELQSLINSLMNELCEKFYTNQLAFKYASIFEKTFLQKLEEFKALKTVLDALETSEEFLFIAKVGDEEVASVQFSLDSEFGLTPNLSALKREECIFSLKVKEEGEGGGSKGIELPLTWELKNKLLRLPILQTV